MRGSRIVWSGHSALAIVVTQTIPRALRLKAPPVWLEAEGARRSAATIGSMTAAATASSSESSISSRPRLWVCPRRPFCLRRNEARWAGVPGLAAGPFTRADANDHLPR